MTKTLLLILTLFLPAMAQRQQWGAYERAVKLPIHPLTLVGSGYDNRDGSPFYDMTQAVRSDGSYAQLGSSPRSPLDKDLYFIDNRTGYQVYVEYRARFTCGSRSPERMLVLPCGRQTIARKP